MKKIIFCTACIAFVFVLSQTPFVQGEESPGQANTQSLLSVESIVAESETPALPFGYAPYPTTADGLPAYGIPYSFLRERRAARSELRGERRLFSRFAPPPHQPYILPAPGSAPGPAERPEAPPMVAPPMTLGQVPQQDGMISVTPAPAGQPVVLHRPTPFKNFKTLMFAPRPYIGYDPYAGYPPFPGYQPPQ